VAAVAEEQDRLAAEVAALATRLGRASLRIAAVDGGEVALSASGGNVSAGAPLGVSTEKKKKQKKVAAPKKDEPPPVLDVTRLLLKVACIKTAVLHPDADGLYLEDAETGEEENRVVISGLVGKIPIEEMQNRMVILCMNMKPVKMRGIFSTAMVMCTKFSFLGVGCSLLEVGCSLLEVGCSVLEGCDRIPN
jgi:tRNA-binding EMAP/Myf-like protein